MRAARSTGASWSLDFLSFFATAELCTLGPQAGRGEEERRSTLAEGRVNSSNDIVTALSSRVAELSKRVTQLQADLEAAQRRVAIIEEYDATAGRLVGNFPQAFSHVGLINTARNLSRRGGPAEHRKDD